MKRKRAIIRIDEELCNGCGQCILACAEGALKLVDGKARLVSEVYCDGLGACIGECPTGALTIEEREAEEFDEQAVEEHLQAASSGHDHSHSAEPEPMACGCPGSQVRVLERKAAKEEPSQPSVSELGQWPIKLQLLGPRAPFLQGADLVLLADCVAVAFPDLHRKILRGHAVAIGCPKLDDLSAHITRLTEVLKGARPKSLTVAHMEVPCCHGFVYAAEEALRRAGMDLPLRRIQIGINGEIQEEELGSKSACDSAFPSPESRARSRR